MSHFFPYKADDTHVRDAVVSPRPCYLPMFLNGSIPSLHRVVHVRSIWLYFLPTCLTPFGKKVHQKMVGRCQFDSMRDVSKWQHPFIASSRPRAINLAVFFTHLFNPIWEKSAPKNGRTLPIRSNEGRGLPISRVIHLLSVFANLV